MNPATFWALTEGAPMSRRITIALLAANEREPWERIELILTRCRPSVAIYLNSAQIPALQAGRRWIGLPEHDAASVAQRPRLIPSRFEILTRSGIAFHP